MSQQKLTNISERKKTDLQRGECSNQCLVWIKPKKVKKHWSML